MTITLTQAFVMGMFLGFAPVVLDEVVNKLWGK